MINISDSGRVGVNSSRALDVMILAVNIVDLKLVVVTKGVHGQMAAASSKLVEISVTKDSRESTAGHLEWQTVDD